MTTQLKELNEREQVGYYHARSRSRSFRDPAKGLSRTHRFVGAAAMAVTPIDTDAVFPSRTTSITFVTEIEITGAAEAGIVFEFGDSTTGIKLAISAGSIFVAAGDVADVLDVSAGADGSVALAALGSIGARVQLTVAVNPGTGQVRVWADDNVVIRANAPQQMFNGWAAIEDGAFAAAQVTSSTQRGQAINGAPTNFDVVRPLDVFQGQLPRNFGL